MQHVGARLGDDVHHRSRVTAVLGAVGVRLDLEFLDRVGGRAHDEAGVEGVVVAGAVEQEVVRLVAHAVDAEPRRGGAEAARGRIAGRAAQPRRWSDDTRNERPQLGEIAAVEWQLNDLLLVDDRAERGARRLDERCVGRHLNRLLEPAYRERQVYA